MFTCLLFYVSFCCFLPSLVGQQNLAVDQLIGVNWQISSSPDGIECAGFVREFSRWVDTQSEGNDPNVDPSFLYPDECLDLNPAASGNPAYINFNYQRFQEMGLSLTASMTSTLPVYSGSSDPIDREKWKPLQWLENTMVPEQYGVDEDGDGIIDIDQEAVLTTPGSYVERADWIYQYVSQFVTDNMAPVSTEKICDPEDAGNPTPIFQYIESWNEPNLPFPTAQRNQVQFTPQEYAAMASCDFDGHEGTVLAAESSAANAATYPVGVRNASPGVQFVMGAPFDILYLDEEMSSGAGDIGDIDVWDVWVKPMYDWFVANRDDEKFVFDVLNFHHYSVNGPNTLDPDPDDWISPEEDLLRTKMENLVFRKNNEFNGALADREIWISEFGYDTNQDDFNGWDFDLSGFPAGMDEDFLVEQLQAQWISRSFLEFAAAGIDRAIVHDLNDGAVASFNWDKTTGLHTFEGDPKESWFHVFGMRNILEGYRYVADESINCDLTSTDTECDTPAATKCTRVYRFENNSGDQIWAVWSPTSCAIDEYSITVDGVGPTAGVLKLGAPSIHGISQSFSSNGNDITLLVDETPSFILQEQVTPPDCPVITVTDESCSSVLLNLDLGQETFDQFQVWYGTPGTDPLNFSALSGNMEQFIYDADGNTSSILLTGLAPNTTYTVAVFPETESGIPIDALGDPIYCTFNVSTNDNNAIGDICNIPADDILSLTYSGQPGLEERIFDRQNSNLCAGESPGGFEDAWVNFQGDGISQATVTFTQNYVIEQLYLFDMGDAGILEFEWLDGENNTWNPFYDYLTNTTFDWKSLDESLFNQPSTGIRGLRITTNEYDSEAVGNAIISELFICGRPVCPIGTPTATPTCTDADFTLNASGTECAIASELTIQGNNGIETHPINQNNFNYPSSFFVERGPNQLIPGVTYNPEIETCSGTTCTTETLPFTAPNTGNCVLESAVIDETDAFLTRCADYVINIDANVGDRIQFWRSNVGAFNSLTEHPLIQRPDAVMFVTEVESIDFGGTTDTGIRIPYNVCSKDIYIAYRYITEDRSSELSTLSISNDGSTNTIDLICACGNYDPGSSTPSFIIEDCYLTDIVYDYLEVGEKLQHKEFDVPSTGAEQLLHSEIYGITNANYTYDLKHATNAEKVDFREKETNPWVSLDLTAVPCITTNNPPPSGTEQNQTTEAEIMISNDLRLYPNPARNYLNIEIAASADLLLIGVDGKSHDLRDLKKTSYGYQFSTNHLIPGLYLIRTIDEVGKIQTGKFLVQE